MLKLATCHSGLRASPTTGLNGTCRVPGDKSVSHRAIIIAAMAEGTSHLTGLSNGDDVWRTLNAVREFGAEVRVEGVGVAITGASWQSPSLPIDCGNSGTSARLLMGAAAGYPGLQATFIGDDSLSTRPMKRIVAPLKRMGARFECARNPTLPITIFGRELVGICHRNLPASAQIKSALMLAGLNASSPLYIVEPQATRDHGELLLQQFGCHVEFGRYERANILKLHGRRPRAAEVAIGGDPSAGAYPLVAALLTGGSRVRVEDVVINHTRTGLIDVLEMMGARIKIDGDRRMSSERIGSIECESMPLRGVDVPASFVPRMIDEYPIAAVAAASAKGTTFFRGLGELRFKESNRLEQLAEGLTLCGVDACVQEDDLIITGSGERPIGGAAVDSHGDHRLAMAFAVLGLASRRGVTVERAGLIATSFPAFADTMRCLGAAIRDAS